MGKHQEAGSQHTWEHIICFLHEQGKETNVKYEYDTPKMGLNQDTRPKLCLHGTRNFKMLMLSIPSSNSSVLPNTQENQIFFKNWTSGQFQGARLNISFYSPKSSGFIKKQVYIN